MTIAKSLSLCSIALLTCAALSADVVNFNGLPGNNGDAFSTYTEGAYTVTSTAGSWQVAQDFGNPVPDVFCDSCSPGTLQLTSSAGDFTFNSVDIGEAQSGGFPFTVTGFLGGNQVFTQSGAGPSANGTFGTFNSADSVDEIDTLDITINTSGNDGNVDNINITPAAAAPEPGTFALLAAGFGLVTLARKRRA